MMKIHVVGAGLAGCEAAWQCLRAGISVVLHEMRPSRQTAAHQTPGFAELVCSNSMKSKRDDSAPGQLKFEMAALDSLILKAAYACEVPAGQALGVDRILFSNLVTETLSSHPLLTHLEEEVVEFPDQASLEKNNEAWIIATGPLTSDDLCHFLNNQLGTDQRLYFYDAIAPIIAADSIDKKFCFRANRYEQEQQNDDTTTHDKGDYLNIPLDKVQYETFIDDILAAEKMPLHSFEKTNYFEACLPIEVMVERGRETLRFGPMKPVGLYDPLTQRRPYGVIQLRQETIDETMYSLVGFQSKMKWTEQERIFKKIPALANAEFLRFGSIHRNTYLESPKILNENLALKSNQRVFLAGQMTGVEGYSESTAMGLLAGRAAVSKLRGREFPIPPRTTMMGSLLNYVTKGGLGPFQPMNANFGLLPSLETASGRVGKNERKQMQCQRAKETFTSFMRGEDTVFQI